MAAKIIKLQEETISEILVADTDSESGTEASDFEEEEERKKKTTTASLSRSRRTGCSKWRITNLGTASRKEHKYPSFCRSSKRCEKKWGSTHQDSSPLSVLLLFFTEIFHLLLVRNLTEEAGKSQDRPTPRLVGRPSSAETNVVQLESCHNQHWPAKSPSQLCCWLFSSRSLRKGTVCKCARCDVGLCWAPCFAEYHTKVNL